ncbi:RluA family pseudouridine synthase [Sphingomonas morindae]|uniref:RNA pseudouridine synthase n=1 Tax=Sphingomonas morindae TaxID=1541170 RepID=A0ABY4X8L5_9SPHN|nr:RNA pseudouridine synthase [Sphingomonas morindae]USI73289.1 RNA pseudouridine synthase [Sphingomonas morindae]
MGPEHILFLDGEALLIDKPAGLPVDQPRRGGDSVTTKVQSLSFGFRRPPQPVHRLDTDTSGCLLLARNPKAHQRFAAAFAERQARKTYLAVLDGVPAEAEGRIALPLGKRSTAAEGWRMVVDPQGKPAVTAWRLLGAAEGRALVEFRPETGRTHQLRVHAADGLGLPIVGDPLYGVAGGGLMLHAWRLEVPRPPKPPVRGEAPLPARFAPWHALLPQD